MKRSSGPRATSAAASSWTGGGVALDRGLELQVAARDHDRHAVVGERAGEEYAVAGAHSMRPEIDAVGHRPDPGGRDVEAVGLAALDDLRVAGDNRNAGNVRAAAPIDETMRRRSATGNPSSITKPAVSQRGCAPAIARSLTVPLTASSPIEPPGNSSGCTT